MLFNSYVFIFLFLPLATVLYSVVASQGNGELTKVFLVLASLVFYAWWNPTYIVLLVGSIGFNFAVCILLRKHRSQKPKALLAGAIFINLLVLGYYKYSYFLGIATHPVDLPLAISFFTFQQIAFLVDSYMYRVERVQFLNYVSCVTFFPHLIAGPLVNYRDLYPQFARAGTFRLSQKNLALGLAVFILGLAKKVLIADQLKMYADAVFESGTELYKATALDAWLSTLSYSFQIYFDFSGYSDMAIGLGRIFMVVLPVNFLSPYQSPSVIEFWKRWHITLSSFLRNYLYIPLGGNRKGALRKYLNLFITMLVGGIWHGAGFGFIIWGALHGGYLCVNHFWDFWKTHLKVELPRTLSIGLTFAATTLAWVFFRAEHVQDAVLILKKMTLLSSGTHTTFYQDKVRTVLLILGSVVLISFWAPNVAQIFRKMELILDSGEVLGKLGLNRGFVFSFNRTSACVIGMLMLISLVMISRGSHFIYYQF